MALINGGKGFNNIDIEAYKIEQEILKKEREERKKVKNVHEKKPVVDHCIVCNAGFSKRSHYQMDLDRFESVSDAISEFDDEELYGCLCDSCAQFLDISPTGERGPWTNLPAGWGIRDLTTRLDKARELGYATILRTQSFGTPSGSSITIEFGDVFPIKRVGVDNESGNVTNPIDVFSIDILVGIENLKLFPWEFGTISWADLMTNIRLGEMEAVYLGSDDLAGYYEPTPEIKQMLKNAFGDR